jgi:MFS family permease
MATNKKRRTVLIQRRGTSVEDQLRPQRWNWSAVVKPLDTHLEHQAEEPVAGVGLRNLRYFWLDGLFAAASENFYISYVVLFALAYGATNGQVGWLTAVANLLGALALFPGARLIEVVGKRKPVVVWSGGGVARFMLLLLALMPLFVVEPLAAIVLIIALNGIRAFAANLANPAWTSMVADIVPSSIRGRYFGSRNMAMGIAALIISPLAGRLITAGSDWFNGEMAGYQIVLLLAFAVGMVSTVLFQKIKEPAPSESISHKHQRGDLRKAIKQSPGYLGLVASAFVWNLALQVAAPFFNVYLVDAFDASTATIGVLIGVSSLSALFGQRVFGRLLDTRGSIWVQMACGLVIPVLPFAWMFITAPWQVGFINALGGFVWAGYNLATFNLLLILSPDVQRPRAVALYQTAVFSSAVIGPLLGGYLADAVSFQLIFGLSAIGRLLGMVIFFLFTRLPYRKAQALASQSAS